MGVDVGLGQGADICQWAGLLSAEGFQFIADEPREPVEGSLAEGEKYKTPSGQGADKTGTGE